MHSNKLKKCEALVGFYPLERLNVLRRRQLGTQKTVDLSTILMTIGYINLHTDNVSTLVPLPYLRIGYQ